MKLIKCHIDGFGCYINKDFVFDKDFYSLCLDNGSGKTTLTSFIIAMLYSMESVRSTDKIYTELKDRKRYEPLESNKYGGTLTLEKGNKIYTIIKTFDSKSDSKDTYRFIDEFNKDVDLGSNDSIGEFLFNVSKNTFLSTIFINSDRIDIMMNEDISSKLNGLIDVRSQKDNFKNGIEKITKKIKDNEKEIKNIKEENNGLNKNIDAENEIIKEEERFKNILNNITLEIERLSNELKEAYQNQQLKAKYDRLNQLNDEINNLKARKNEIDNEYPLGFFTIDEIKEIRNIIIKINRTHNDKTFNDIEKNDLELLNKYFSKDEDLSLLNKIENESKDIKESKIILDNENTIDNNLAYKFRNSGLTIDKYNSEIKPLYDEYYQLYNSRMEGNKKKVSILSIILYILSTVLMIVGVIILVLNRFIPGLILLIVGIITLIIATIILIKPTKNNSDERFNYLRFELEKILSKYKYPTLNITTYMDELYRDIKEYSEEVLKDNQNNILKGEIYNKELALENKIKKYNVSIDEILDDPKKIYFMYQKYSELSKRYDDFNTNEEIVNKEIEKLNSDIAYIYNKYNIEKSPLYENELDSFSSLRYEYESLINDLSKYEMEINELKEKYDFSLFNAKLEYDLNKINSELENKNKERNTVLDELKKIDEAIEKIGDFTSKLKENDLKMAEISDNLIIYNGIKDSLIDANTSLIQRYIKPIKDGFIKYSSKFDKAFNNSTIIDENLNINIEINHKMVPASYLSSGERTLENLSIRLSLIDEMYKGEMPFIILDDPFVYLDKKGIIKIKELVKDILKDKQVIYLYCHDSRAIED